MTLNCFFNRSMKFINIFIPKKKKNNYNNNKFSLNKETNNKPCPPVQKSSSTFFYSSKNLYKIEVQKIKHKIIFSIIEEDIKKENEEDNNKEFIAKLKKKDFLELSNKYYTLFNDSLNDIYFDILFNLYNNNFILI